MADHFLAVLYAQEIADPMEVLQPAWAHQEQTAELLPPDAAYPEQLGAVHQTPGGGLEPNFDWERLANREAASDHRAWDQLVL